MILQRVTALLITLLIITVAFITGCAGDNESPTATDSNYIKATATKNGISFSFEYHASYGLLTLDTLEDTGGDPSVSLLYGKPGNTTGKADKLIYIRACDPLESRPDAATWTDAHIDLLEKSDSFFEIIERSAIQVAGIDGQMVAYRSSILGDLSSPYLTSYDAYIDYQGYIWKITVLGVEELADQVEPDFEHLIESFQFLN